MIDADTVRYGIVLVTDASRTEAEVLACGPGNSQARSLC